MSPVSKGRKKKPAKGGRKTGAQRDRPGLSGSPFGPQPAQHGFDAAAYLADLSPMVSMAEVEDTMDRRVFAMPYYGTTIRGEDFPKLNPADPDERTLLIEGEHPEYHQALADPRWDGEIDGVNPRLHLALHEMIANQLWAGEPREAWQAARRLRERRMDRHDVLHELMGVATEHLHPALVRAELFESDTYRLALNALGRTLRPGDTSLNLLHHIIQIAFGWENCPPAPEGEPRVVCLAAEDSGGIWGCLSLLEAIADPEHPTTTTTWTGWPGPSILRPSIAMRSTPH